MISPSKIFNELLKLYPNAKTMLNYKNEYEFLIAVVLSAQTTDNMVNKVSPTLFLNYPNFYILSNANILDVERIIRPIGLYKNKAKNIIELSKIIHNKYMDKIPDNEKELLSLPGVGIKVCNVILANLFKQNVLAIDTHIKRIILRLDLSSSLNINKMISEVSTYFKGYNLCKLHHLMIYFGRNICKAKKPDCKICPFKTLCKNRIL